MAQPYLPSATILSNNDANDGGEPKKAGMAQRPIAKPSIEQKG
jgi:hypothetical protein